MNYDPLNTAIEAATRQYWTFPGTYREIRDQLREKSPERWKGELAKMIAAEKNIQVSSATRNINRYEQFLSGKGGQARNPEKAKGMKAAFESIGKGLEPLKKDAPAEGLTIRIDFKDPSGGKRGRNPERSTPDIHLDHSQAVKWINQEQPDYRTVFHEWSDDIDMDDLFGEEADYEAEVDGVSIY